MAIPTTFYSINRLQADINGANVINRVRILGAQANEAGTQVDTFSGNGLTYVFTLTKVPVYAVQSIVVDGVPLSNTTSWWWWYIPYEQRYYLDKATGQLTFTTPPSNAPNNIVVTYTYSGRIDYTRLWTDLGGAEPDWWFEHLIDDPNITDTTQAQEVADSILIEYGEPTVIGSFVTNKLGLLPGMQISITDPVLQLSGAYTIRRVTTELDKAGTGVMATVQFGGRAVKFSALFAANGGSNLTTSTYLSGGGGVVETSATLVEGPGISILGSQIGLGGDTILRYSSSGEPIAEYIYLAEALTAATAGDVVQLPACTLAGDYSVPAGVTLMGLGTHASVLTGQITGGAGAILENLAVTRTANDATKLVAVVGPATGALTVRECDLSATQAGAGDGYAISVSSGDVYVYNSRAYGSTALSDEALPD